jgi:transposase
MGFFVLLSNNPHLTSAEVIKIYRGKDEIEKHFAQFKNDLDFNRLRTHQIKTTEGKIFIGFLALILRSYILNEIKKNTETKKYTFEKVLIELKKIKLVILSDIKEAITTITKTQKSILAVFNISAEMLVN